MTRKKQAKQTEIPSASPQLAIDWTGGQTLPGSPAPQPVAAGGTGDALRGRHQARKAQRETCPTITTPRDVHDLLGPEMSVLAQEQLRVLLLNTRNLVIGQPRHLPGKREFVDGATRRGAAARRRGGGPQHHHQPQPPRRGDPSPSPEDVSITRELTQAAKLLGVELLDHIVIGGERFVSLKERGLMAA